MLRMVVEGWWWKNGGERMVVEKWWCEVMLKRMVE